MNIAVNNNSLQLAGVQCNVGQCSAVQCIAVQCSEVQCSLEWSGAMQCKSSAVQIIKENFSAVQFKTVQFVQCSEQKWRKVQSRGEELSEAQSVYCFTSGSVLSAQWPPRQAERNNTLHY